MSETMWVTPVPGRAARDPRTMQPLPPEGRSVPVHDQFWLRRVRDGDATASDTEPEQLAEGT
jgi:hypothetical protein